VKTILSPVARAGKAWLWLWFASVVAVHAQDRLITADWNQIKGPTPQLFHECIGAGRANEGFTGCSPTTWAFMAKVATVSRAITGNMSTSFTTLCWG
jgi:hypothetical protein